MKFLLSIVLVVLALSLQFASAKPWIQGVDLPLPREVDPESPIVAHPDDCHVFYMFNYPMTCGEELVFNPDTLACEPAENVSSRPECAS
ncbi:hypothetical protein TCAL_02088 [Tigriopus californicus]|uniref:Chitin-binding type-2 domain-containing protein n=1 Tax=Tigriopus californicus TaxID=6832 RepID=A0A553NCK1_TIGCA|nr:hypothetical protein TCAL_02088 [Tigriopus californicus]|eukprot:TCALIF_02088-PA protein Name:"Protein of unknown function" AED:0.00 eAED:0.00 QI:30/1/1/1/1/1/2/39/88